MCPYGSNKQNEKPPIFKIPSGLDLLPFKLEGPHPIFALVDHSVHFLSFFWGGRNFISAQVISQKIGTLDARRCQMHFTDAVVACTWISNIFDKMASLI